MHTDRNEYRAGWYGPGGIPGAGAPFGQGAETGAWYSPPGRASFPPPAESGIPTHQPPPRSAGSSPGYGRAPRKKPGTVTKVVALTVCVLILIFATAYIFSGSGSLGKTGAARPPEASDGGYGGFDDYGDYFDSLYTATVSGENNIAAAPTGTGVTLALAAPAGSELSYQDIYRKCSPAVVGITAYLGDTGYYWGTGIIFTEDGYVVTNYHVLDGTDSVSVTLSTGEEREARLVGFDAQSDLAVLKIDADRLTAAEFGDSSALEVGETVLAIGNPLGQELQSTMTDGIVSAISRDIDYNGHSMTLLQTNAAINEGNSGGPLINLYGQVVGITNMKMMSSYTSIEGIGFAIPSRAIKEVVDQLIAYGYVPGRPVIGITVGPIPSDAASYFTLPDGLYVSAVNEKSDAYEKGIRAGDIITEANGTAVTTTDELNALKDTLAVGDTLLLTVYREGETFVVDVVLLDQRELTD